MVLLQFTRRLYYFLFWSDKISNSYDFFLSKFSNLDRYKIDSFSTHKGYALLKESRDKLGK